MLLRRRSRLVRIALFAGLSLAALGSLTGCGSNSSDHPRAAPVVRVAERDFRIKIAPARVRAGDVRLMLKNKGPDAHELIMVRAVRGRLPLRTDGLTVDEEGLKAVETIEAEPPGTAHELLLHLKPGRYELFCNMAGHYLGGMRAVLVVT
jgi:uncharacterized cupredoxin-like copper-binding protein